MDDTGVQSGPTSPATGGPEQDDGPRLVEFAGTMEIVSRDSDLVWILLLIFLVPALLVIAVLSKHAPLAGFAGIPAVLVVWAYFWRVRVKRDARRLTGLLDDEALAEGEIIIRQRSVLYKAIDPLAAWPRTLARALAGRRLAGYVLSVGNAYTLKPQPLEPLTVPFEPVPLDANDASFRELASCSADPRAMRPTSRRWIRLGAWSRELRPLIIATGFAALLLHVLKEVVRSYPFDLASFGMSSLVLVLFLLQALWSPGIDLFYGLFFLVQMYFDVRIGWLRVPWLPAGVVAGWVTIMAAWWFFRRQRIQGVWIFPGGLLIRGRREVHRRKHNLLIWHPQRLWVVSAKENRWFYLNVSREEAMLAVRAWLSTAATPSDEMISSFLATA
jgi:hypothetical protein